MSRNSFAQSTQQSGNFNTPRGAVGQRRSPTWGDRVKTLINTNPEAKQVSLITVTATPSNDHDFTVTINEQAVTYTSDASATRAEVSQGLYDAILEDPVASGAFDAAVNTTTGVITLTGRNPGTSITITSSDAEIPVTTPTAAASANPVSFGVAVLKLPRQYADSSELCGVASTALLVAKVDTIAVVDAVGEEYTVILEIEEERYVTAPVAAAGTDATTAQAIVDAINAILPANTILATRSTANVVLTAEVAGKSFVTSVGTKSGTAARMALTHTTNTPETDFLRVFAGVAEIADNLEGVYTTSDDSGATAYKANAGVKAVSYCPGGIFVDNDQTPTDNSRVYVELSPSTDTGKFFTATGATRLLLPRNFQWQGDPAFVDDGLGLLVLL